MPLTAPAPTTRAGSVPVPTTVRPHEGYGGCRVFNPSHLFHFGTEAVQTCLKHERGSVPAAGPAHGRSRQGSTILHRRSSSRSCRGHQVLQVFYIAPAAPRAPPRPPVQESRGHAPPQGHWLPLRRRGAAAPPIGRAPCPSAPPVNTSPAPVTTVWGCGRTSCALSGSPAALLWHRGVPRGHLPLRGRAWLLRGKLALPPPPCRERSAAGRRPFLRPCHSPAFPAPWRS